MTAPALFTIGHSNRTREQFGALLEQNQIAALADVRSQPWSRRYPHFSRSALASTLKQTAVEYLFLGEELGARRNEPECYDNGRARYDWIARTRLFRQGLDRVRQIMATHRVALMCAERDPLTCHRAILVCRHLREEADIVHIIDDGVQESHAALELRILSSVGLPERDLFHSADELLADGYDRQASRIEYCRKPDDES